MIGALIANLRVNRKWQIENDFAESNRSRIKLSRDETRPVL